MTIPTVFAFVIIAFVAVINLCSTPAAMITNSGCSMVIASLRLPMCTILTCAADKYQSLRSHVTHAEHLKFQTKLTSEGLRNA